MLITETSVAISVTENAISEPTDIPTSTPTNTSEPPTATNTDIPTPTITLTHTPRPTSTPTNTPTSSPTPTEIPQELILYEEDFEDGTAPGWITSNGVWEIIVDEDGNHVYQGSSTSYSTAYYRPSSAWQDYIFEIRVKPASGSQPLIWVHTTSDFGNGYYLNMDPSGAIPTIRYHGLTDLGYFPSVPTRMRSWNTVQIRVSASAFQISIDGHRTSEIYDETFSRGGIGLSIDGTTLFDDIRVWSLD